VSRLLFLADGTDAARINVLGRWAPVDLSGTGPLVFRDGRWVCSPREFSKLYQRGFARLVVQVGTLIDPDAAEPADHVQALAGSIEEAGSAARGFADALDALREAAP